ncbi:Mannan endo-1,6-alpha-mannosidase [Wickerhamomyces ciferrii]|uniref:Mannan endo-1,6-alpha-mannosidase n=1 Tax=Wickerhamomyces ciferrii (strain ATCC 14091 / BCRC 22168 / CBS 111 / JCM 3599 / NBRC 0793 / NRRL Y-1031 F-60-10) TaxID=1206466 RepID=K0KSD5_WICCF|nr:Mannan endo-1,6-alpha-mannosidase [Wickerhamomyces ciferrii]CCH46081.1 Mannan endo-1,6-alpha-mannosidase [Wickerhamomyces ciferrii]
MKLQAISSLTTLISLLGCVSCVWLTPDNLTNLKEVTGIVADGLLNYYNGRDYGKPIGMFSNPYYWWEAGGAWGSMIDFWFYMENDTYLDMTKEALLAQAGDNWDYVPLNQSTTEGNDDQGFWGIAVMAAAERKFPDPDDDQPQWLYLAQAVFNTMASRWDGDHCHGGLRWQIFEWNSGYDYKNAVSNGCLFNIAARLARYTGNDSYVDWAEKVHDWMEGTGLMTEGDYYFVYDGVNIGDNCSEPVKLQWTYNQGLMMSGAAYLYNYTGKDIWLNRTMRYLSSSSVFFNNSVMYEVACQNSNNCNNDQRSFKAFFSRFLGLTAQMVPETYDHIYELLEASARAASNSCSGGSDGNTCGLDWSHSGWDGYYGMGEQMAALEVMQNLRIRDRPAPVTNSTGGTSHGSGAAGTETSSTNLSPLSIDGGDKAGAAIITCIIAFSIIGIATWLLI